MEPFSFATSESLNYPVVIRIINLEGDEVPFRASTLNSQPELKHMGCNTSPHSDLFVTAQIFAGSKAITVPVQTSYKSFRNSRQWFESLTLPMEYSQLPVDACIAITIWDLCPAPSKLSYNNAIPFGGTTIPLFDADNHANQGRQKCHVHRLKHADGNSYTTTPAFPQPNPGEKKAKTSHLDKDLEEIDRIEKLFKQHEMGEIPKIDWLDQMVFRGFERQTARVSKDSLKQLQLQQHAVGKAKQQTTPYKMEERPGPSKFVLHVELPMFDHPVVFADHEYKIPKISCLEPRSAGPQSAALKPQPDLQYGPGIGSSAERGLAKVMKVYDPENGQRENPAETKHRRLIRSTMRNGFMDRDLKPNPFARDELNSILSQPPTYPLSSDNKDIIWKFRYHLAKDKRALTKFIKSVNWDDAGECKEGVRFLGRWAFIDVDDALELLGPTFTNPVVRSFAVERLRKADDKELLLYLLQLVQALKFEHIQAESTQEANADLSLAHLLIQRGCDNFMLGNYLFWYLMVEVDDKSAEQSPEYREMYSRVSYNFMVETERREGGVELRRTLKRQAELNAVLGRIAKDIKEANLSNAKKVDLLRKTLLDPENELVSFDPPLPLPLDPAVKVTGVSVKGEDVTVFKSSLCPIKVTFKTDAGKKYQIIFKKGDDLRQDQLCIQIITLMDQLLQKENLDLRLSPYKILATSTIDGISQFVESKSFQNIVNKYRSSKAPALEYLRIHNPDPQSPAGVRKEAIDNYIRSCAGYSVITYILGVGDRHLDNLLLAPDGHFFHADFGYILGRDPKPMAPMVKVSKEMVDAMGGLQSEDYKKFKHYCFLAYAALRKSSNLILNLFTLMVDANIPDIRMDPERAVLKVEERLALGMREEDAIRHLERTIEDAYNALGAAVIDVWHGWYQGIKS
ncbi:uncharacterized protein MKZ38_003480 [Zalerion maritima]|uniref:Phosphatidylinositol 3-kinase VPS34 n=1 Tax=Zalerion maritima TaxID=339359 RepID=A0AAD5RWP9_9PEZI|nr:uncharacterized protein MKZ38_003480 [Zalerion maritima]